jgi:short-subunit dehydrogenase
MKSMKGKTALVTGASSGIGEAFAWQLAATGVNLILTARAKEKLIQLAQAIREKYSVRVAVYAEDLFKKEAAQRLFEQVKQDGLQVDILVNNAGFGKWAHFLDESIDTYQQMIELNITAVVKLTHLFLPAMVQRGEGGIINICSTGSFQPCPYVAVYCAAKAFALSFSEALYGEYHNKGITVTAVCPGNTDTAFFEMANANTKGMSFDPPSKVAEEGLKALLKGKNYTVIGLSNYFQSLSSRFFSRKMIISMVKNMFEKKVYAAGR